MSDDPFVRALSGATGDVAGAYAASTRAQDSPAAIGGLPAGAHDAIARQLATLDLADASALAAATELAIARRDETGLQRAISELERDVLNPSADQSATAVLDKVSAAALIESRQKQQRVRLLAAMAEQLLVDAKRARDTEAATLNMQRTQLLETDAEGGSLLTGSADDLRTWRQP
jgi:hypothetical protein